MEAYADGDAEVAEALECGFMDPPPGILAMPIAPTEQAVDEPDPVLDVVPDRRIGGAALPPAEMLAVLPGEDSTAPILPVEPSNSAVST